MDSVAAANKLRREIIVVQAQLEAKRTDCRERMESVRQRELALTKQKEQLQERLVKFYKLIQENDIKKNRAEKKASAERSARVDKEKQIVDLEQQIAALEGSNEELRKEIDRYQKYQRYLDAVLASSDEYQHAADIIQRAQTLDSNNRELQHRKKTLEEEVELQKLALQRRRKQMEDEILEHTNTLSQLQDALEASHKRTLAAADRVEASAEARATILRTVGQVRHGLQNLYEHCLALQRRYKRGRAGVRDDGHDLMGQLRFVGECVADLIHTVEKAHGAPVPVRGAGGTERERTGKGEGKERDRDTKGGGDGEGAAAAEAGSAAQGGSTLPPLEGGALTGGGA
eukprot:TRINITY_DN24863_c0_g1_i1.p1 TRINITY_DN24863_c0_g1~~TRINITY_DN24863_c0_g1_i1.p1  ORF type:complete len:344 (-),score=83.90 TRINITY_DN24863_c0_g1_i1:65-1096(-)